MRILVTGGAGSWGSRLVVTLAGIGHQVCVYSRDEEKHRLLRQQVPEVRYFLGDVRDANRLQRAMQGCEEVYHLAALKQIDACTYNPIEAVRTNVNGTINVLETAIDCDVARVLCMSTDKAVEPTTLYGHTKACVESLVKTAHAYVGKRRTRFAALRCGNAWGSRGSIVPVWKALVGMGETILPVTDPACTRFTIRLEDTPALLMSAMESIASMPTGSILAPRLRAYRITDLAEAFGCSWRATGLRPQEKVHEAMAGRHEWMVPIQGREHLSVIQAGQCDETTSEHAEMLTVEELRGMVRA